VSLNKLAKRLRREFIGNPKKGAVLLLLVAVAVYFWVPLVWGWIAKDDPVATAESPQTSETAKTARLAAGALPVPPTAGAAQTDQAAQTEQTARQPKIPWQQVVKWMDNDPRTLAAHRVTGGRNPFVTPKREVVQPKIETEKKPVQVEPDATPASLGMALSGTIIGSRRRVARIDGKTYRQGQTVAATKEGRRFEFTLAEIHPRYIVLKRDKESFELKIPAPGSSGGIELLGSTD